MGARSSSRWQAKPRPWRVWDLDMELRYRPVVAAIPPAADRICEIGSGPVGIAAWTPLPVVGLDRLTEERVQSPPNLELAHGDATRIPFEDESFAAAVAVDVLEHVRPSARAQVVHEMIRITKPRGRVILMGPTGSGAAKGDRKVLERLRAMGALGGSERWLSEHVENGLPTKAELETLLSHPRIASVTGRGFFNLSLWYVMHLAAMGALPRTGALHAVAWRPFAAVARRAHVGECYRRLEIAELGV
jgi:SAM-dependent methyltransferase